MAARPLPLTAREREILTLAARGLSNKALAERLTVSVRTVEGNLYRAGLKLGVSERTGSASWIEVEAPTLVSASAAAGEWPPSRRPR
jgi:DNA-binding NarL/FixJ family response regulator